MINMGHIGVPYYVYVCLQKYQFLNISTPFMLVTVLLKNNNYKAVARVPGMGPVYFTKSPQQRDIQ